THPEGARGFPAFPLWPGFNGSPAPPPPRSGAFLRKWKTTMTPMRSNRNQTWRHLRRLAISALAGLAALGAAAGAQAADIQFAGVLPNGAMFTRSIESMAEGRFRNLVRQHTDYSCGAAALATILRYGYRLEADEATVIEG